MAEELEKVAIRVPGVDHPVLINASEFDPQKHRPWALDSDRLRQFSNAMPEMFPAEPVARPEWTHDPYECGDCHRTIAPAEACYTESQGAVWYHFGCGPGHMRMALSCAQCNLTTVDPGPTRCPACGHEKFTAVMIRGD